MTSKFILCSSLVQNITHYKITLWLSDGWPEHTTRTWWFGRHQRDGKVQWHGLWVPGRLAGIGGRLFAFHYYVGFWQAGVAAGEALASAPVGCKIYCKRIYFKATSFSDKNLSCYLKKKTCKQTHKSTIPYFAAKLSKHEDNDNNPKLYYNRIWAVFLPWHDGNEVCWLEEVRVVVTEVSLLQGGHEMHLMDWVS